MYSSLCHFTVHVFTVSLGFCYTGPFFCGQCY